MYDNLLRFGTNKAEDLSALFIMIIVNVVNGATQWVTVSFSFLEHLR